MEATVQEKMEFVKYSPEEIKKIFEDTVKEYHEKYDELYHKYNSFKGKSITKETYIEMACDLGDTPVGVVTNLKVILNVSNGEEYKFGDKEIMMDVFDDYEKLIKCGIRNEIVVEGLMTSVGWDEEYCSDNEDHSPVFYEMNYYVRTLKLYPANENHINDKALAKCCKMFSPLAREDTRALEMYMDGDLTYKGLTEKLNPNIERSC